jgi:RNA polymerase sigma-54 factor
LVKNSLLAKTSLQHVLTPQQVQYLKILQLPITSLEHTIKQEIAENPFLEEFNDSLDNDDILEQADLNAPAPDQIKTSNDFDIDYYSVLNDDREERLNYFLDEMDNYDYYEEYWEDDNDFTPGSLTDSDKDYESFQIKSETTLYDLLIEQINILDLSLEDKLIATYIIGNIDSDGYLRREMSDILTETNSIIAEHNFNIQKHQYELANQLAHNKQANPAKKYELTSQSIDILLETIDNNSDILKNIDITDVRNKNNNIDRIFKPVSVKDVDKIIKLVQTLEPPGIASRNIQECLIAQLNAKQKLNEGEKTALMILQNCFDEFSKKHFLHIQKKLGITKEQVKDAFDEIKKLNPKPGGDDYITQHNTIIPDFIVRYDDRNDDFIVNLNDANVPMLKVSQTYEKMLLESKKSKEYNKSTRDWMKERYENAKFFIQAVHQRNISMLMVMTAIVYRQREFFLNDVKNLKPMIYKDIADDTSLDISTVCRIVNGKYVQTSTGVYELKFFFSEFLLSDDGEEIATTVIKDKLKEIIASEPQNKPYSDEQLKVLLKDAGYNVARRTIAKYRETLKIPVARLRKEL